jgi:hypothetical protein
VTLAVPFEYWKAFTTVDPLGALAWELVRIIAPEPPLEAETADAAANA